MIPGLGPTAANVVDAFLNRRCRKPSSFGELEQLSRLFSLQFRRGLERLLNGTLLVGRSHGGPLAVCDVQIGWIDKVPIAGRPSGGAPGKKTGTEIGDAVIFSFDQQIDRHGGIISHDARAVVLQAKIATSTDQISAPTVPINVSKSTPNELSLLSTWPLFDLRATGSSRTDLLVGVDVNPPSLPAPHAWFIAAPGVEPAASTAWPSWWMAGRALSGDPCTTTFGQLLVAFLEPSGAGPAVGFEFNAMQPAKMSIGSGGTLGPPTSWSDLCNAIRWIIPRYGAPPSKFGLGAPRGYSIPWHQSSFISGKQSDLRFEIEKAAGLWPSERFHLLSKMEDAGEFWPFLHRALDPFRRIGRRGPIVPEGEEAGMFVMTVTKTRLHQEFDRG